MSDSQVTTVPNTPESFTDDVTNKDFLDVFAQLCPHNEEARRAFDTVVQEIVRKKLKYQRQFVKAYRVERNQSPFSEYGESETKPELRWSGAYIFRLQDVWDQPEACWRAGTGRTKETSDLSELPREDTVEFVLAPPRKKYKSLRIGGRHLGFSVDPSTYRLALTAFHSVIVGSSPVLERVEKYVLAETEILTVGATSYKFEYTPYQRSDAFTEKLSKFFSYQRPGFHTINRKLTPSSGGTPVPIGPYYVCSTAFGKGTLGFHRAAWTAAGHVFAVKQLKRGDRQEVQRHVALMNKIGRHDHVLYLKDHVEYMDSFYLMYTPLTVEDLSGLLCTESVSLDFNTRIYLLRDFLDGLSFLHARGIMHLDIKEKNLAVTSLQYPRGIILDMDGAVEQKTSNDHRKGTLKYLAPEIVALKLSTGGPQPVFDCKVDVWAMGLVAWALFTGHEFRGWIHLLGESLAHHQSDMVSGNAYKILRRKLATVSGSSVWPTWIEEMTQWDPHERSAAADVLKSVSWYINEGRHGVEASSG